MGGAAALQHRVRCLRQASCATSPRWCGRASTARIASSSGASCRTSRTRRHTCWATHGVERGDRVAIVLPATPETAAIFFGVWKLGAILLSMSVLYGDDSIRHRLADSGRTPRRHRRGECSRFADSGRSRRSCSTTRRSWARSTEPILVRHRGRRSRPALLHVGHDRAREGHRPRPSLHPRPRGVRLLPRSRRRRALPRHGRVGVGCRDRATSRALAARRGAVRLPA